jgi:hypothetical protein
MSKIFPKSGEVTCPSAPQDRRDCIISRLAAFEWQAICSNRRVNHRCVAQVNCMSPLVFQSPIC